MDRLGHAGRKLSQWGMMILLEEIVHIYIFPEQYKRGISVPSEVYDANDAFRLSAADALMNAHSYVLYTSSESAFWLCFRVAAVGRRYADRGSRHIRSM